MAIRYTVDLIDTERAALREIISKNKAKRSTIINGYCSKDTGFIQPVPDGVRRGFVDGLHLGLLATCPAPRGP